MYFEIWYEWRAELPPKQWAAQWCCHVPMPSTPEEAGAVVASLLRTKRPNLLQVKPYYAPAEGAPAEGAPAEGAPAEGSKTGNGKRKSERKRK